MSKLALQMFMWYYFRDSELNPFSPKRKKKKYWAWYSYFLIRYSAIGDVFVCFSNGNTLSLISLYKSMWTSLSESSLEPCVNKKDSRTRESLEDGKESNMTRNKIRAKGRMVAIKANFSRFIFSRPLSLVGRRKWQPTPVFFPGEPCGQRSLVGCCP